MMDAQAPNPAPAQVTTRDLWAAIDNLRVQESTARHDQGNQIARAMGELRTEVLQVVGGLDQRMRSIEAVILAANPGGLGPRIVELERWRDKADGAAQGGVPARVESLEDWREQMRGVVRALTVVATLATVVSAVATVIALVQG